MKANVTLSVDCDTLTRLDAEAERLAASRSYAARRLLAQALDRAPSPPAAAEPHVALEAQR